MKYAIVIFGGAADQPLDELQGKTPLEAARCPTLKRMGETGRFGQLTVLPEPIEPTPDAAILSLLGYDAMEHYPGNAPLRAGGLGLATQPGDWAVNLSLLSADAGIASGADAVLVPPAEARALFDGFADQLEIPGCTLHPTPSGMHLLLDPATTGRDWSELATAPPSVVMGKALRKLLPVGGEVGEQMQALIAQSQVYLQGHEINLARKEMGEPAVTHFWPWGQGRIAPLPNWSARNSGKSAVLLTADPAVRGLALATGLAVQELPDDALVTDPEPGMIQLGCDAVDAIQAYDLVIVDANPAALAGMDGHVANKIDAIQLIDRHVLKPIDLILSSRGGEYRLLTTPLYASLSDQQRYESLPVPFVITGYKMQGVVPRPVTEAAAKQADLKVDFGYELMEYFLKSGVR